QPADLLIEARWLLPIAPANVALAEHALAVSAGRILAVGPAAELRERFEAREHVVRSRHVLLPGLVNAHTHASHALLRGLPVRGPRSSWLRETLAPIERRCLSADFVRDGTRLALAEMLRAGITCFADLSLHPEEAARAAAAAHAHRPAHPGCASSGHSACCARDSPRSAPRSATRRISSSSRATARASSAVRRRICASARASRSWRGASTAARSAPTVRPRPAR